ncbi:MAG TPA: response regulator transcription factor [Steroidobacteraceae bacterium]|jgi:DNA-binding response OmpR family regulator|nr:response regulator transcription factor [Steroidobacteraceae bacterium]
MVQTILIAEDDPRTVGLLRLYLEHERYRVLVAADGRTAIDLARTRRPDLIVLDLMLPRVDGLDVCRVLRAESRLPIIMLTARAGEEDKLLGLDLGADDYVVKPFSPRELVARVRVVLRRVAEQAEETLPPLVFGALTLDPARHQVTVQGRLARLTPTEFQLLSVLAHAPGRVFTREQLLARVFGPAYPGTERTLDVHMMNLRRKIEQHPDRPEYLHTVFGIGYKFEVDHAPA